MMIFNGQRQVEGLTECRVTAAESRPLPRPVRRRVAALMMDVGARLRHCSPDSL
ncbi:hypothetical protein WDV93_10630 [Pantoea ananatis]